MADASLAIPKVLSFEGVWDNDPKDPGGETCFGITRKYQPQWAGWVRVEAIKRMAGAFKANLEHDLELQSHVAAYYTAMWQRFYLDKFQSQELAECVYNGAINQGPERTLKWLQYCVNALSVASQDVSEDGVMGEGTAKQVLALEQAGLGGLLLTLLKAQRIAAYTTTVHNREDSLKFIKGWINRINQGG